MSNDTDPTPGERRLCTYVACESCSGGFWIEEPEDARCNGCGMVVCQSCCDAWSHVEGHDHGRGDPSDGMRRMRAAIREALSLKGWSITFYDKTTSPFSTTRLLTVEEIIERAIKAGKESRC